MSCGEPLEGAALQPGYCAHKIPVELERPRSILSVGVDEFLVFERGSASVIRVFDRDGDGVPESRVNIGASGGNHGLAYFDGHIYISSDTTVWRWQYVLGSNSVSGDPETVVVNINEDGQGGAPQGHTTRTLAFDSQGRLYVSVGSASNIDSDSHRSRIRRFPLSSSSMVDLPFDFQLGEVFADGLRNEVGLAFDSHGVLWGVENGADDLFRFDLGGDIHNDNPAEELNRFPEELAGSHWGYPECWTEYNLELGLGRGTVWSWPSFLDVFSDQQCREERRPAELAMQGHSAPLGIVFYRYVSEPPEGCDGTFPLEMDGFAFIGFHGSWNRDEPTGYKVVYVPMTAEGHVNASEPIDLLSHSSAGARWESGFRPVDVDFDACGRLLVTSDGTNGRGSMVVRIAYSGNPTVGPSSEPSPNPRQGPSSSSPSVISLDPSSRPSQDSACCRDAFPPVDDSSRGFSPRHTKLMVILLFLTLGTLCS